MKKEIELYCSKYYKFVVNDITEKIKCSERKICAGCQYLVDYEIFMDNVYLCELDSREQRLIFEEDDEYPYYKEHEAFFYQYKCKYRYDMGEGAVCTFSEYCDQKE